MLFDTADMLGSALILIPVIVCGTIGGLVGYFYRFQLGLRRALTVAAAVLLFLIVEVASGTLSSKYSIGENLSAQFDLIGPFLILYLLPAISVSFLVARQLRKWR